MSVTIRRATEADQGVLVRLYDAFVDETLAPALNAPRNPDADTGREVARMLAREPAAVFVAESAGAVEGFAYVSLRGGATGPARGLRAKLKALLGRGAPAPILLTPPRGWLAHLYVTPEHRRMGVAALLVRATADWARSQGARTLELNVSASNAPARRFYEKFGMTMGLVEYRLTL